MDCVVKKYASAYVASVPVRAERNWATQKSFFDFRPRKKWARAKRLKEGNGGPTPLLQLFYSRITFRGGQIALAPFSHSPNAKRLFRVLDFVRLVLICLLEGGKGGHYHVSRKIKRHFWTQTYETYEMIFEKLHRKYSLVKCLNHPSASCSVHSKNKSEQEYEEG